jgi:hypothetical protein
MTTTKQLLPTADELRATARKGRLVDRVETYLPDSLYRRKSAVTVTTNGHVRSAKATAPIGPTATKQA